jgi:hypothetical protein
MGRERSNLLWPARKRALEALRSAGVYGYLNEAAVHVRSLLKSGGFGELPEKRFFIFAHGRSGSRLLCDLLHSHPDINCDLEILAERAHSPRGLIEAHARMAKTRAHGFKFKIYQLTDIQGVSDVRAFVGDLSSSGWSMIYLKRRNVVRLAVSGFVRAHTGVAHRLGPDGKKGPLPRIAIHPERLLASVASIRERQAREEATIEGLPVCRVVYDDDLLREEDQQRTGERIVAWLGLEPARLRVDLTRTSSRKLADMVENFDEIARVLEDTGDAALLDDG